MNSEIGNALLIAGIDAVGITRLPQLFARAGYRVGLLSSGHLAAAKSRFVTDWIPSGRGPQATAQAAREHLAKHAGRYTSVILADEPTLWAALDTPDNDWLKEWFPVPLEAGAVGRLTSKVDFLLDSAAAGIATPRFQICNSEQELWAAAQALGYPLFVKPTRGFAGSGLIFAKSKAALDAQLPKVSFDGPVLTQEEIDGSVGSISVLYDRGRPVCWFSYLMRQTWPNRFSSACTIRMYWHPDAESLVHSVGKLTGFHGLAGIDWILEPASNRLLLLEFNPRPTPVYHLGPYAGVDFARALADSAAGSFAPQHPNQSARIVDMFPQSLYYSMEHRNPRRFAEALKDAPWNDPRVVMAHFRRFMTHYFPSRFREYLGRWR